MRTDRFTYEMFNEGSPPLGSLPKCLKKCSPPCSPPFTKEFVNRYRIRINKGHLLFTEHQFFWKSIKKSSQKVKKCEIFSRFWKIFENFRISPRKIDFENYKKTKNFPLKIVLEIKISGFRIFFEIFDFPKNL